MIAVLQKIYILLGYLYSSWSKEQPAGVIMIPILSSSAMLRVFSVFLRDPSKNYQLREISRMIGLNHKSISIYVRELVEDGLARENEKTPYKSYCANCEIPAFKRYKRMFNAIQLYESGFVDFLNDFYSYPAAIVLFGSYSKGEDVPISDIDVLVITPLKKLAAIEKFEKLLGHRIQLYLHSAADLQRMKTTNKELLNSWINGICVQGYMEIFT